MAISFKAIFAVLTIGLLMASCKEEEDYSNYKSKTGSFNGSALEFLQTQQSGTYDSLLLVLDLLPDLKDSVDKEQITIFAPTNASFEIAISRLNLQRNKEGKSPIYLNGCDKIQLDSLVSRYMFKGQKFTDDFKVATDGILLRCLKSNYLMHALYQKQNASGFVNGGPSTIIYSDPKGSSFVKYWERTKTVSVNIKTNNAVVNVLEPHEFGFNEFIDRMNQ